MVVEVVKSGNGWLVKCSDSMNRGGGPVRVRGTGIMIYPKDIGDLITAIDKGASGNSYTFTRSDGVVIRSYPSETKSGSIVVERSGGNWIRLDSKDALDLRLVLTRL